MARPDPVAAALAQAKAEAETLEQTNTSTNVATTTTTAAPAVATGQRRSLADLAASAAMAVDFYFGVDDLGIKIGKDKSRRDEVLIDLRLKDIKGGWIIRGNVAGGGVKYFTTYDGAVEAKSRKPWEQVIAQVQQADGNAYASDLIEMPVALVEEINDFKDKSLKPLKAGSRGGISLSYQNYKYFCSWFAEVLEKYGDDKVLRVKLGFQEKSNPGGNAYGIYTWEIVEG